MAIRKILVANRSEIAIRVFRAANELGIGTVAVFSEEDKLALHRFKADEAYQIGKGMGPIEAYLSIPEMLRVAREADADAIHPGYGFLSESPDFAEACAKAGLTFIGPSADTMRKLGDKVSARNLAVSVGVPVMPATDPLPRRPGRGGAARRRDRLPADAQGVVGRRRPRHARHPRRGRRSLHDIDAARREAKAAFGKDEVYLEKLVERARHVEVQILADKHGSIVHLFERDCTVQRRHQKVVERAPAPYLDAAQRQELAGYAVAIAHAANYAGAGTVEFLMDSDTGKFYFIEVNPRIQVEHTVTEQVTGIDIVKAQIRIADGAAIGDTAASGVPRQGDIRLNGHALQCRITTEDPEQNFIPDYGRITAYRGATGFGIRLDGGTAYSGAVITRYYDPLLEKVTAWAPTAEEAIARMNRALREFRIRGVATNLAFLENVINHPKFRDASYTTRFIDETPELFEAVKRRDRATKLLTYIADVTVNGHPDTRDRPRPPSGGLVVPPPVFDAAGRLRHPAAPRRRRRRTPSPAGCGTRSACSSPTRRCATPTSRCSRPACGATTSSPSPRPIRAALPGLLSLECWGGATFDVAMRFLTEDPWERLADIREKAPNILLQMLLRGSNARRLHQLSRQCRPLLRQQAAEGGIDLFRVFDCLNWVENMRVSMDAVREAGKLCEGAICYTGDILDPDRAKYSLKYYVGLTKELESGRRPHHRHQGHGRAAQAGRGEEAGRDAPRRRPACRSTSTPTTPRASRPPR